MKNKRIAFIGNLGGSTYWYVKMLREAGVDAFLYITFKKYDKHSKPIFIHNQDPREQDQSLGNELPPWVKTFHLHSIRSILGVRKEFNQYDLNIAFKTMPVFLQFCKTPLISFGTGTNLREEVFRKSIRGILLKRGFQKSKIVLFDNVDTATLNALKRLGIKRAEWIPDYLSKAGLLEKLKAHTIKKDFLEQFREEMLCFMPSRLNFSQKGSDILLRALADFDKQYPGKIRLLAVEFGKDVDKFKQMVKDLGLTKIVTMLPLLDYADLLYLTQQASLVFGYFCNGKSGIHHFPLCLQEGLALGSIVISSIDTTAFQKVVGEAPFVLEAFSYKDIKNQLEYALKNYSTLKAKHSKQGPLWLDKYASVEYIRPKLVKIINKCI